MFRIHIRVIWLILLATRKKRKCELCRAASHCLMPLLIKKQVAWKDRHVPCVVTMDGPASIDASKRNPALRRVPRD